MSLTGVLNADTRWTGAVSNLWSDPANWTNGLPNADQKARFANASAPECIMDMVGAQAKQLAVGDNSGGSLRLVAGDLTVDKDGVVNVSNQASGIGQEKTGNGSLYVKGGTINYWAGGASLGLYTGKAEIDLSGGTLTLTNTSQNRDTINKAIADRIITAYEGAGKVIVDTTSAAGRIVVTGLYPFQPAPLDGGRVSAGSVELMWTMPDPCQPGQPVAFDVCFGASPDFPVGGSVQTPQIIKQKSVSSVVVQTTPKTRYYWAVDTYFRNAKDPVFSFVADNLMPTVKAGTDVVTWLKNGSAEVALKATVTDDGFLSPYTAKWTVASEPSPGMAALANPEAENTAVTLKATGQYDLKLEANDGEYTGLDTVTINVFTNSCEAAKSSPGDLNGDCVVNDADLAILQANWLKCNTLDCSDVK